MAVRVVGPEPHEPTQTHLAGASALAAAKQRSDTSPQVRIDKPHIVDEGYNPCAQWEIGRTAGLESNRPSSSASVEEVSEIGMNRPDSVLKVVPFDRPSGQ